MEVKLKEVKAELDDLRIGDALILDSGEVRIIVRLINGYGAYSPHTNVVYHSDSSTIKELIKSYSDIDRVVKSGNLELVEK